MLCMDSCIFCKIISHQIPAKRIYEDEQVIIINDINPLAPQHLLAIPKKHFASIHEVPENESGLFETLLSACRKTIIAEELSNKGYRMVINSGSAAGQSVDHLHVHILSGRQFQPSPG